MPIDPTLLKLAQYTANKHAAAAFATYEDNTKRAFVPAGDPAQGGAPGGDPSQGGAPPPGGDPSQAMPPDPSMGGAPPAPAAAPAGGLDPATMAQLQQMIQASSGGGGGAGGPGGKGGKKAEQAILDAKIYALDVKITALMKHFEVPIPPEATLGVPPDPAAAQAASQEHANASGIPSMPSDPSMGGGDPSQGGDPSMAPPQAAGPQPVGPMDPSQGPIKAGHTPLDDVAELYGTDDFSIGGTTSYGRKAASLSSRLGRRIRRATSPLGQP